MNATEVFQRIAGLPEAAKTAVTGEGFVDGRMISGIEFVQVQPLEERSLRAAWKRHRGNTASALVLFTDDPENEDAIVLIGPNTAEEPIRSVGAEAFADLVAEVSKLTGLGAVRTFAREISTLDSAVGAGVVVRGIGSAHLFHQRIPEGHGLPEGAAWADLESKLDEFSGGEWIDLLRHFGYELTQRKDRGFLATVGGKKLLVIHSVKSADDFARLNEQGMLREGALLADCQVESVPIGLLVAGGRIRIYLNDDEGGAFNRYLQLDVDGLADGLRPLLALLAPEMVEAGVFESIQTETRDYGSRLRDRLDQTLRQQVLPVLGRELGRCASDAGADLSDDEVRDQLEGAALTFVFRALFLLYAEGAGYLPMKLDAYRSRSVTNLCERAFSEEAAADEGATTLWDDFTSVVHAMRSGKSAWGVPPYNGELFAPDGLKGAETLEEYSITDGPLSVVLASLGRDINAEDKTGLDYSGLDIGHLGHIYEGLLSLRLSVAEKDLTYVPRDDRYRATPEGEEPDVRKGELTWLTHEGGRKGGGVYYTPAPLVRHLVRQSVRPAFEAHIEKVVAELNQDPEKAAEMLFEFHVVDPACGSAHFLVQVADELADQVANLMGRVSLPGVQKELDSLRGTAGKTYDLEIEDAALLKRLVIKQCVFGVDISPMGVEIAKLSLWLAGFVPGLSLAYLDRNVICGNSLVGVIDPDEVTPANKETGDIELFGGSLSDSLRTASKTANELQQIPDRTPDEISRSRAKNAEYEKEVAGANNLMDIWTASFLGFPGARDRALQGGSDLLAGELALTDEEFIQAARGQSSLNWPTSFAETFSRENPGFDVVVGNPPWEEVTIEELAFYARYRPGLRGLPAGPRAEALAELKSERPELGVELEAKQEGMANLRTYLANHSPEAISTGDPDLYKYFAHRYQGLLRSGGRLGVVLPRSAFLAQGTVGFRRWLQTSAPIERLDLALNSRGWMFDIHPQYTVALVNAKKGKPSGRVRVAGVATSLPAFEKQVQSKATTLAVSELGPDLEVPLAPGPAAYDLFGRMSGTQFALGGGTWRCFPVRELDETNDKGFWRDASEGWELWKGGSFDQYDPAGAESRSCPVTDDLLLKISKANGRPGSGSQLAEDVSLEDRRAAVERTIGRARVAFRDVSRAADSRTIRACLVPPETLLLNSAPYLVFLEDSPIQEATCLGVMNSVPFDWYARRFVENHVNFFVLEILKVPELEDSMASRIGSRSARLSAVDDRFTGFADSLGVEVGPIEPSEGLRLRSEIDALVAKAWDINIDDLQLMFQDFPETEAGISAPYRTAILEAYEELD